MGTDGSQRARAAAVRWACGADGFTRVVVREEDTCSYVIIIMSPDMCD